MSKNTAEYLLKVQHAAQFLMRVPQATVLEAMHVARFSDNDITNLNLRKQIVQCLSSHRKQPASSLVVMAPVSSAACSPMATGVSDIMSNDDVTCPPPKCMRMRKTALAAMKHQKSQETEVSLLCCTQGGNATVWPRMCQRRGRGVNGAGGQANKKYI
jgi:hypothetical protein